MLATIVDTAALWKIVLAVFAVGAGATTLFGVGVRSLEQLEVARADGGRTGALLLHGLVVALVGAVCLALVVLGFVAMTHK